MLDYREKAAVTEWLIGSNASFHVMHDHPGHCGMPIQGGKEVTLSTNDVMFL